MFIVIFSFTLNSVAQNAALNSGIGVINCVDHFKKGLSTFVISNQKLLSAIQAINTDTLSIVRARDALKTCRLDYKKIEFFTTYFFSSETNFYNAPPKYEVEEPELELSEPMGLQQIEALLFESDVLSNKASLITQAEVMVSSAGDLHTLLYQFKANDAQILESLRIELIRMSVLSISGYDAPLLKSGIMETAAATVALHEVLRPYIEAWPLSGKPLNSLLENSFSYLTAHPDFDAFDRMEYLREYSLPLQKSLGYFIKEQGLEINTTQFLNYEATDIYKRNALRNWNDPNGGKARIRRLAVLGKQLFFDKALSGNSSVSCATCHRPANYFADDLSKSPSIQTDSLLKRNTPTLLYAGWQHSQFWDGRAVDLKGQVHDVVFSPLEMNGSHPRLYEHVFKKEKYEAQFNTLFPEKETADLGVDEISEAIAAFVQQLNFMDSPFDQFINGRSDAMTQDQVNGFNLFMGKAQCGSCHFPPFFNSLLPPFYDISEVEVLGTTRTDDLKIPELDSDAGRYDVYHIRYYRGAFKTPTVRNVARTAPYMHHGAFGSLAAVMDFYNRGGGKGLGLDVQDQTLSSKPLDLSKAEIDSIILFLESLTDSNISNHDYLNYVE